MSGSGTLSEPFEHIGHQLTGELAGEALNRCGVFLDECGQIGCGLILLAEDVVVVLVENAAVMGGERDGCDDGDDEARRLLRGGVVGERGCGLFQDRAV